MGFTSWLGKRRRSAPSGRGPSRTRSSCRPRLEVLEDRNLLNAGYVFSTIDVPNGQIGTTVALGINNRGDVVGDYADANGGQHGYLRSDGRYTTLDAPNAGVTYANGVNDRGQVVGTYFDGGNIQHGFLLNGGKYTTLDDPNGVGSTVAEGINDRGQIVGYYTDANGADHGFLFSGGKYTTLDDPSAAGGGYTIANGINDRGQIVGTYADANSQHGFLFSGGKYTTLDAPNAVFTAALGINSSGQIVGYYADANAVHGFLRSGGKYSTLDDPNGGGYESVANGINNSGEIVGYYTDAAGGSHGFLATRADNGDPKGAGDCRANHTDGVSGASVGHAEAVVLVTGGSPGSGTGGVHNNVAPAVLDSIFSGDMPDNIYDSYTDGGGNTFH